MSSAKASGSNASDGSSTRHREHRQGNQDRKFTVEQEAAVIRIRRCGATDFYDILGLESVRTTCTETEIKKAYRKQSLLTHPDKNGHQHADEAFKMVSRAFGILGDKEKREKYDKFGGDPDSRFQSAQAQNPFSGFRQAGGGRPAGGMYEEELTPEEMFARFFGGGFGGGGFGGGGFGGGGFGGPEFVFNFGGGPGIRVHQFGGGRPQTRPRNARGNGQPQQQQNPLQNLIGLLPIILFFVVPMLSSLFSFGPSTPSTPRMVFEEPTTPYTYGRVTPNFKINYFVNEGDIKGYTAAQFSRLDVIAEETRFRELGHQCERELMVKRRKQEAAQGWFYQDVEEMAKANALPTKACDMINQLKRPRKYD
ncbi:unnamed protein product [Clonostachys rhizophaga]|uniref:J domain-containing protein n=1 Tax=Clonostachys rhizophaga TaxID=160324 RepID=A0A9N9V143_9HYPO|nr:unnamed protein product [Clonostachys rhizophaga]